MKRKREGEREKERERDEMQGKKRWTENEVEKLGHTVVIDFFYFFNFL